MAEIWTTSEEILRRLIALEKSMRGVPVNAAAPQRRRHITNANIPIRCAILTSDLGGTGSATATLYTANAGTETDSGLDDVTVYDWLGDSGFKIESGTKVFVAKVNGFWYVIGAGACPVSV